MNSNFPNRWSPASLTFNNYFYLFLYLYITWITINNNAPHPKSSKNQNRRAALGRPAIKITGGLELVCGRPTLALSSALVLQIKHLQTTKTKTQTKSKAGSWIEGQVATMLKLHTRQIDTTDTTTMKRAKKNKRTTKRRQNRIAALGRPAMKLLGGFN